ncbi:MAG: adenine deaminase [Chloroflexi bacterium HGW-Chloroflexi-6]|nr:MAG: adenine deaminase [Chloroflexi bacterium HGW-Chloroflexi-6]
MLSQTLVNVAMGRTPADLVIKNGKWVCVQTGEIIPKTDIAIVSGHIAFVGENADHAIGEKTQVIDAHNSYLVPGLLDGHMHVESGMVTVTEFVRAVAPLGTTGIFVDPHEIANVFGLKGVKLMVDEAAGQPIHVWVQMPSCVPSAPGMETPGASISPADVAEAMTWPGIIGLGEMMNFPGVVASDEKMHAEMHSTRHAGKTIGGHYPTPDLGRAFHGYVAGGPEDDHEGTRPEDAIARARQGMKPMLRYGSAWHDVATQVKAITKHGLDPRRFLLCTDDSHAATLAFEGHMDRVVRHAISEGLPPMTAIQMATINTAEHFGLSREMGMIAPGRYADVVLVRDLKDFHAELVVAKGKLIAENGKWKEELAAYPYPAWVKKSVKLAHKLTADDFKLPVTSNKKVATCNVIGIIENQAPTRHLKLELPVVDGQVSASGDVAKLSLVDRHHRTGKVQVALVSGFGLKAHCAIATTVAHDSHHMIVIGTDDACMAQAANHLAETGGGQVVVKDGEIIGEVQLPIAGLMSNEHVEAVAQQAESVLAGFAACGSELNSPNMQMALLGLVVIPELRISDKGLVDVTRFEFIPVVESI